MVAPAVSLGKFPAVRSLYNRVLAENRFRDEELWDHELDERLDERRDELLLDLCIERERELLDPDADESDADAPTVQASSVSAPPVSAPAPPPSPAPTSAPAQSADLPPLGFTPKPVSPAQQPQVHPDRSLPGYPVAQPLWGAIARMQVSGGPWRLSSPVEPLRRQDGRPRKPDRVEVYPGEFVIEPDPTVSTNLTTAQIMRACYRAGWTLQQVESEFDDRTHSGGEYARFAAIRDPGYVSKLWEQIRCSDSDPYYAPRTSLPVVIAFPPEGAITGKGSGEQETPEHEEGPPARPPAAVPITGTAEHRGVPITGSAPRPYLVSRSDFYAVLQLVRTHPNVSQAELIRLSAMRNSRCRGALAQLAADGRIHADTASVRTPAGTRKATVWSLAESTPSPPSDKSSPIQPPTTTPPPGITPLPSHLDPLQITPERVVDLMDRDPNRRRITVVPFTRNQPPEVFARWLHRLAGAMKDELPDLELCWRPAGVLADRDGVRIGYLGIECIGTARATNIEPPPDTATISTKAGAVWRTVTGQPDMSVDIRELVEDDAAWSIENFLLGCRGPDPFPLHLVGPP